MKKGKEVHMKAYAYFQQRGGNMIGVAEVVIPNGFTVDEALESVYERLQNLRGSWSFGPMFEGSPLEGSGEVNYDHSDAVTFLGEHPINKRTGQKMGERSMMIGDLIHLVGDDINKTFEVDCFGFKDYVEAA